MNSSRSRQTNQTLARIVGISSPSETLLFRCGLAIGAVLFILEPFSRADGKEAVTLSPSQVVDTQDVPVEENILPTRPVNSSLYGFDTSVQDTPRSIQQVSADQLKNDPISSGQDLSRYSPGLSQNFANGTASAPYIRGQTPDQYQNGIRVDRGGTSIPFTNNAIEQLDIVAGPASSVFGPSASTSGYINYITKAPFFDQQHTEIRLNLGNFYIDGESNNDFTETLDTGGPLIKDKLADRVSLQGREGNTFFGTADPRTKDPQNHAEVFAALTWLPTSKIVVDTNLQFNDFSYASTRGFNRVTQDLIDHGNYISGIATPILRKGNIFFAPTVTGRTDLNPTGVSPIYRLVTLGGAIGKTRTVTITNTAVPSSIITHGASPGAQTTAAVVGYVFEPQNVAIANIRQNRSYTYGDQQEIRQWQGQNRVTIDVSDDFKIKNTFYVESLLLKSAQVYQTTGTIQDDDVLDDRVEFLVKREFSFFSLTIKDQSNSGIDFRTSHNVSYSETLPYTDSSDLFDPRTIDSFGVYGKSVYDAVATQTAPTAYINAAFGDVTLPARPAFYPVPGYSNYRTSPPNSIEATTETLGLYTQHELKLGGGWTWTAGGRASLVYVDSTNPTVPVTGQPVLSDTTTALIPAVNTSLLYKVLPSTTAYATFAYTQALNANDIPTLTNGQLGATQFHSESFLYESGAKTEFIPNKLYGSLAGFLQLRNLAPQAQIVNGGTTNITPNIRVRGIEASLQYQPDRHWSINTNFTWTASNYLNYRIFSNKSPGPNIAVGTQSAAGVVALINQDQGNAAFSQPGFANYRESLIPEFVWNFGTSYQFNSGFGLAANGWVWGPWNYFILSNIKVPAQYNIDLSFFYTPRKKNWDVRLTVTNVTNQWNFQPNGAENVNDFIAPLPPLGVRGTIAYRF